MALNFLSGDGTVVRPWVLDVSGVVSAEDLLSHVPAARNRYFRFNTGTLGGRWRISIATGPGALSRLQRHTTGFNYVPVTQGTNEQFFVVENAAENQDIGFSIYRLQRGGFPAGSEILSLTIAKPTNAVIYEYPANPRGDGLFTFACEG